MPTAEEHLDRLLHTGDRGAWTTAALVLDLRDAGAEAYRTAAAEVLRALDVDLVAGTPGRARRAGRGAGPAGGRPAEG